MPLSLSGSFSGAASAVAGAGAAVAGAVGGALTGAIGGAVGALAGGGLTSFPPQQSLGSDQPMVAHMFRVVIGADPFGAFTEVSNIAYEVPPYELIEGGRNF